MKVYLLLVFICCAAQFLDAARTKTVKAVKIFVLENCPDHPKDAIMHVNNIQLSEGGVGTHIYFEANVTQTWPKNLEFVIYIKKCKNKDNLDSCVSWSPLRTTNICQIINMKGQPWTKLTEDIVPPWVCPIKKDYYTVNGTLEFTNSPLLLPVKVDESIWIAESKLFTGRHKLGCSMCWTYQAKNYHVQ